LIERKLNRKQINLYTLYNTIQ